MSGTDDGDVTLWNIDSRSIKCKLPSHSGAISGACFISEDKRLVVCSSDGEFRVTDLGANVQVAYKQTSDILNMKILLL